MKCTDHFLSQESFELLFDQGLKAYKTFPVPESLEKYYDSEGYFSHNNAKKSVVEKLYAAAKHFRNKAKWKAVLRLRAGADVSRPFCLFDFGSGDNSFVLSAPEGVISQGYDPFSSSATCGYEGSVDSLEANQAVFDAITLWHSLEHTASPLEELTKLRSILKPGGQFHIAVPNNASWDAEQYKTFWAGYDVPRHLWHFSYESFEAISERLGLELVSKKPQWFDAFYVSYLSEKYKGSAAPLLKGSLRTLLAMATRSAFKRPSALYVVLKKPLNAF
jgi:SAM-dependent methyltransferase